MKDKTNLSLAFMVINFTFFIIGMTIVWNVTHNWIAMGGAFVASIHYSWNGKEAIGD